MGSKHKDKKKHKSHENPQTQLDLDDFEQDNNANNDDNLVETEPKKPKNKNKKKKETLDVKIQTIHAKSDKISPLVGYFPTTFDPFKGSGSSSVDENSEVTVYQNVQRSSRYQVVVKPNGSDVNFVGTNYSGEAAAPQICTYALGVLDKETQTLRIVPITSNKVYVCMEFCFNLLNIIV